MVPGRHHAAADADPEHAHGAQRRAREGARLDRQLLCGARDQGGVPARQAAALPRRRRSSSSPPWSRSPSCCSRCRSRAASLTLVLGGVIYVLASTGFGLLISVFASTQTAAIFAAAIITILPAVQFSGMFVPVSSLTGGAWFAAQDLPQHLFPGHQRRHLHQGAGHRRAVAQHRRAGRDRVVYFGAVGRAADASRRTSDAQRLRTSFSWAQGAAQPGARSGAAVPDRLLLHLLGLHAGQERGDGRGQRLGRDRRRGRFASARADHAMRCCRRCSCRPARLPFSEINRAMDAGKYTFVVDMPPQVPGRPRAGRQADRPDHHRRDRDEPGRAADPATSRRSSRTGSRALLVGPRQPRQRSRWSSSTRARVSIPTCSRAGSSPSTRSSTTSRCWRSS